MTELLQKVIEQVSQLPPDEQETFAAWMLEELRSEQRWNELFARSQDLLEKMADEALAEHKAGKTLPLDPDEI
jgi:16S rRNA C967 or C1407 C5-methylase (RsmB/RsmF family)